jgi:NAD(P)H-hydrate epimerase
MRLVTNEQMRRIDSRAQRECHIPGSVLMENAGRGSVEILSGYFDLRRIKVLVACGVGNNGGDGMVIARYLKNRGSAVKVLLIGRKADLKGDAREKMTAAEKTGIEIVPVREPGRFRAQLKAFRPDCIIDAIFGTGFRGEPRAPFVPVIEAINDADAFILAIDIPSGVNGDTGAYQKACVIADATAIMCLPKRGNYLYPGREFCGDLHLVDIGVPGKLTAEGYPQLIGYELVRQLIPRRPPDGNKGTFGRVLMIAGARGYSGAAVLAARAAFRTGAGLVHIAAPRGIMNILEKKILEAVKVPLPETDQETIGRAAEPVLRPLIEQSDVLVVGPGITSHPETARLVRGLLPKIRRPMIIDADALNILAQDPRLIRKIRAPFILTPHPGEFARLVRSSPRSVNERRIDWTVKYARQWGGVVVLKGAPTVIASPAGDVFVNPTGNSGLATAGSGDVLAGMIAGFLAQTRMPLESALCGVFLHGLAADRKVKQNTEYSLIAGDLIEQIPGTLNYILRRAWESEAENPESVIER